MPRPIAAAEPEMPAGLYNRAADNWRRCWPSPPRRAVTGWPAATRRRRRSRGRRRRGVPAGASARRHPRHVRRNCTSDDGQDLLRPPDREAVRDRPRPWAEYGKSGKPLTQNRLARLLKPLGIVPQRFASAPRPPTATSGTSSSRRGNAFFPRRGSSNRNTGTNAMK